MSHTVLMTGASRGLGRSAAAALLRDRSDRHLLLTVRGHDGDRLAAELTAETGNPHVSTVKCELASLSEIRAAAAEVGRRLGAGEIPPLHGFLGNAGVQMTSTATATEDGFETTFGVNVLAYYLLLRLLLDRFEAPARIVLVGSDSHFGDFKHSFGLVPTPDWTGADRLAVPRPGSVREGRRAYAASKLGVIYLVHALSRRLPQGVDVYTYNPAFVPGTELARDADRVSQFAMRRVLPVLTLTPLATSPETAGRRLAAALTGARPGESGSYLDRGRVTSSSPESYDVTREEELWAVAGGLCDYRPSNDR
jgi:NAD(P)-dependent dehydrogenase (short-subunit alcohol dehydrogenase family)